MRGGDHIVHVKQRIVRAYRLLLVDVHSRAGNLTGLQGLNQLVLLDGRTAGGVDDEGGLSSSS